MKKKLVLAGMIALLTTIAISSPTLRAQTGRDAKEMGCKDGKTLARLSRNFKLPEDIIKDGRILRRKGQSIPVIIELRRSEKCKGTWVKATNVPENSQMYVEDNSTRYITYTTRVDGQSYSDMTNEGDYRRPLRACVQVPSEFFKYADELRQPLCTKFSSN